MSSYLALAEFYDRLTEDVPYDEIAAFYEKLFDKYGINVKTVLDLACGTGTLTKLMHDRGYDMIGADESPEMLIYAREKLGGDDTLLLCQSMEELDLYGTVDAVVCCLDGMNYVLPEDMGTVLHRVYLFLEPGGVFIFDINSPEKLRGLDGQIFTDEREDVFCVWQAELCEEDNACMYSMDIFSLEESGLWSRASEEHVEYIYQPEELKRLLEKEGMEDVHIYGDMTLEPPGENEQRIFITARKRV